VNKATVRLLNYNGVTAFGETQNRSGPCPLWSGGGTSTRKSQCPVSPHQSIMDCAPPPPREKTSVGKCRETYLQPTVSRRTLTYNYHQNLKLDDRPPQPNTRSPHKVGSARSPRMDSDRIKINWADLSEPKAVSRRESCDPKPQ